MWDDESWGLRRAPNTREPQFAEPVPYFATPPRREPIVVTNTRGRSNNIWPERFSDRAALVRAAINELKRAGAV